MLKRVTTLIGLLVLTTLGVATFTKHIQAGFEPAQLTVNVKVGDINFGAFDDIKGLDDENRLSTNKLVFKRNFVTEPSFYLWARDTAKEHTPSHEVELVYEDKEGNIVKRLGLVNSQPIAWAVEASDPTLGGFHERIELAVQQVIEKNESY